MSKLQCSDLQTHPMNYITYIVFRAFVILFRFIPFRLLYGFADLMFYVVYYLVGYRKKVVLENLRNSFPGKSELEISRIAQGFYHHFADMLVESLKAFTMTEEAVIRRYTFNNSAVLDEI